MRQGRIKGGTLKQYGLRTIGDLTTGPAHDPGHGHGAYGIRDHEHGFGQGALLVIQGGHTLACGGAAHHDPAIGQHRKIERVQRLAALEHDIIRDINDVVDRSYTATGQTATHPERTRLQDGARQDTCGIARAVGRIGHLHAGPLRHRLATFCQYGLRHLEFHAIERGHFAGHADHAQAVRTVPGDFQLQNRLDATQHLKQRRAGHRRGRQQHDAAVVGRQPQFVLGTEHALRDLAAQGGLLDLHAVRQCRAHGCERHLVTGIEVVGPADHGQLVRTVEDAT